MTDHAGADAPVAEKPPMVHGVASALSPLVRRIVAPNPGKMTGPGTPPSCSAPSASRR